ncbi:MAG TPA: DUF2188 domain-containing protein [Chitinophagales bacterium]|nr:DUF2188 domain-containing protein [Chitinophagales bacterium]
MRIFSPACLVIGNDLIIRNKMMKRIYIVAIPKGWVLLTEKGERLSGVYSSPNEALEYARPLAREQNAEIIIYPNQEKFSEMRKLRRRKSRNRKNKAVGK